MIALWVAGAQLPAVVAGQSLAEVASAEAERRKAIPRPARLYTNKDLVPVAPPPATVAQDDQAAQADRGDEEGEATSSGAGGSRRHARPSREARRSRKLSRAG
jgi:hypothetical protein